MNREIKFRFWETVSKTMITDIDYLFKNPSVLPSKIFNGEDNLIIPLQFVGLKDKNGIEIYEGDIIQYTEHEGYLLESFVSNIVWDNENASFAFLYPSHFDRKLFNYSLSSIDELQNDFLNHVEVIGNVFQTLETIEK